MLKYVIVTFIISISGLHNITYSQFIIGILPSDNGEKVKYQVKRPSIRLKLPTIPYWDSIQVLKNENPLKQKELFLDDGEYYVFYDSLEYEDYTVKYISSFGDEFTYQITVNGDILLTHPLNILQYKSKKLELADLTTILESDTLKLVVQEIGCYHFHEHLYILINSNDHNVNPTTKNSKIIYLPNQEFKIRLNDFIMESLESDDCYSDHTCGDIYSIKANNKVYTMADCCISKEKIRKLKLND